jgi:hypothetical protein
LVLVEAVSDLLATLTVPRRDKDAERVREATSDPSPTGEKRLIEHLAPGTFRALARSRSRLRKILHIP